MRQRFGDCVSVGEAVAPLLITITAKRIIMGAAASRDWQPQHHDDVAATTQMNLPGIILNTPTQAGWLSKYVTNWSGPNGRIGRMRFRMARPICPGDEVALRGRVSGARRAAEGWWWLQLDLAMECRQVIVTEAAALLALPDANGESPWRATGPLWQPPAWLT
ncbi:MaoC/PaaZ C-terminal domain-containing protein [Burkholderia sp. BCC1993]|uniref:MaoC/PaaZ C-terminal domain-containing protein n=1 Tax=Burkholderia sp. BCC1993 TaxID=2817444 RepID=UPI002AB19DE1|nr:MaoC/PaaZ C-terminal domain-containing protein [Burkholderia sp. BCC1993]